ncbi:hypothetical protein [Flavobacterium limi]|uniref:YcxB-like protein n=1 Tax=Flavobacterium limi TaxID=2045105 RepID=A0ABQ1UV24_9FLAO|nr:hypothetical protein [Flavobacterium limi]GGF25957.1 hypothetical protein GCM10011518_39160 [Flavobacterium limi]
MKHFRTQFNYIILVGRFIFTIFFAGLSVLMLYLIIENFMAKDYLAMMIFGIIFNLIMIYFTYLLIIAIIKQSYNFTFEEGSIYKISVLSRQKELLKTTEIKGFSTSEYPLKIWNFKSLILYFQNGKKIELPQFLYFNFKEIENKLIENSIRKFGHEKHKWKSITSRHYEFE